MVGQLSIGSTKKLKVKRRLAVDGPIGLSAAEMTSAQKAMLLAAINQWVSIQPVENAVRRMAQIEAELDQTNFAWMDGNEVNTPTYMIIQGPDNGRPHVHRFFDPVETGTSLTQSGTSGTAFGTRNNIGSPDHKHYGAQSSAPMRSPTDA